MMMTVTLMSNTHVVVTDWEVRKTRNRVDCEKDQSSQRDPFQ